jgi:signal transduction histidine kinase
MSAELIDLKRGLEQRVAARTAALIEEIAAREELEREVTSVAERERLSIGNDLHDSLSQHFTATAMAAQVLARRLDQEASSLAADARRVVKLVEEGIDQTRRIAKGLLLVTVESDGLATALHDIRDSLREQSAMVCDVSISGNTAVEDVLVATHLYRIAEEAARNAARHSKASRLRIKLAGDSRAIVLEVRDNGTGYSGGGDRRGMGLRIMAHRAAIIGAAFKITTQPANGTVVTCRWNR